VLAPIQGGARAEGAAPRSAPAGEARARPRAITHEDLARRYVELMNALLANAEEHRAVNVFTDVVAWKLAVVAYKFGPLAAADVMRKLGSHLAGIAEAEAAQREANEAKEAGQRPN